MTLFACVHGRHGNCRTCDITAAQDRTTSAVESQTAAVRDAQAAAEQASVAQEARELRARQEAADAARESRYERRRLEREAAEARAVAEVDAEMAREAADEQREVDRMARQLEYEGMSPADAHHEAGQRYAMQRQSDLEARVRIAERSRLRQGELEQDVIRRSSGERGSHVPHEDVVHETFVRIWGDRLREQRERSEAVIAAAQQADERRQADAEHRRRLEDAKRSAHRWRGLVATAALALAGYASWLNGWSVVAVAAAVVVSFCFSTAYWEDHVGTRRKRQDRYDGEYPVFVVGFALVSAALLYLPPWIDAPLWRFGMLGAAILIAMVPLLHRFDHVPTVPR